ncbi:lipid-A-disaccharide synthase N-terminal domain-containing protein [Methylomonas sp. SURF-1]|uniref:Lipid-A-disaccharide synthase N-terminal domain-containing protein n=1 Tax=Methylomonas aurea TaxID=2952224 RepID=A0ABT1UL68_9GAMM|nr:lipid-A-disaccharide synthase N-terminal domain-containing protein [Methylomonas sp. SURF-1]MCQ8182166.1 lipid-A-disaccharide synthase N-terminal domain-containing protein [Methylomonas sp. SURF-1]
MEQGVVNFFSHLFDKWQHHLSSMDSNDIIWLTIGLVGQSLFMMRFIVQWIHSERHQKSIIPVSFWYFSLSGGVIVLLYGIHRVDPVIILGQLPGTFVYARNLMLIRREHRDALAELADEDLGG